MFPVRPTVSSGSGGGSVDLSGYVTTGALATALGSYVTTTALNSTLAGAGLQAEFVLTDSTTPHFLSSANGLNRTYIVRNSTAGSTPRAAYIDIPWDEDGNGWLLLYNASPTAPLMIGCSDSAFQREGNSTVWNSLVPTSEAIAPNGWAFIRRLDANTSGVQMDMHAAPLYILQKA